MYFINKRIILIIAAIFVFIAIILGMQFFGQKKQSPPTQIDTAPNPYTPGTLTKDFERLEHPSPLADSDAKAKTALLNQLGNKSGYLKQSNNYGIEYVKTNGKFLIEIKSGDPETTMNEAISYLQSQGLSMAGVCNLPVLIYLGEDERNSLLKDNKQFNPIPKGCI